MRTAWVFLIALSAIQAAHAQMSGQGTQGGVATPQLTEAQKQLRDYIFNFHHGTLATKVPVDKNKIPRYGWHTTVYRKTEATYEQICGGSLVKKDTAISAAHCFWDEAGLVPADQFAVAVGQSRRRWEDTERYRSNLSEIIVPPRYLGSTTHFQEDIAVLRLETPVDYQFGVRPVCVDFTDLAMEKRHLSPGSKGLITGFGLTTENGEPSDVLNFQNLPYVDIRDCINASEPGFLKYLTSDKICAGDQKTGRALCRGDSGGGLVFFFGPFSEAIIYLRGIASAAPRNNNACNAYAIGSFTDLRSHKTFLRDNIPNLEEECRTAYSEKFAPSGLSPAGSGEEIKQNTERNTDNNTRLQNVSVGAEVDRVPGNVGLATADGTQTGGEFANQVPQLSVGFKSPLKAPVKPKSPNNRDVSSEVSSEAAVKGNPMVNLYFFTGPLVDPSRVYSQGSAQPIVVDGNAQQPTNIYVFIQN